MGTIKKEINNIHDKSYKDLYSNKEIFLDLLKGTLKAPWANDLSIDDLTLANKSYVLSDYEEQESDIVYKAKIGDNEVIFYILLEFQSSIDYRMPLRLLFYMNELLRDYIKNTEFKSYDKTFKVPAIVPIVLYNGKKPWDVPVNFRDIVNGKELFSENIIDFKYDLFDVNNEYTKEELLEKSSITSAIFLLDQKMEPEEFLDRITAIALFFNNLNEKEMRVLKHWIKNTIEDDLAKKAITILGADKEEVLDMVANNAFILTEMKEKAKNEGIQEGKKQGIQEGKKEGIQEGAKLEKIKTLRNLKSLGLDDKTIMKALDVNEKEYKELKELIKN